MNQDTASKILADIFAPPPAGEAGLHVSNDDISAWAEDTLTGEDFGRVQAHLDHCPECAELATRLTVALARRDEPLAFPVFVPSFEAVRARAERSAGGELANLQLAAAENGVPPEVVRIDGLLEGFSGEATGDGCAPSQASTLRLALTAPESPRPAKVPASVLAVWPTGQTMPATFEHRGGRWRAVLSLPLPWPEVVELLKDNKIRLEPVR